MLTVINYKNHVFASQSVLDAQDLGGPVDVSPYDNSCNANMVA